MLLLQRQPGPAVIVRPFGSTVTSFINEQSATIASSIMEKPAIAWPPPRTARESSAAAAKRTVAARSAVVRARAISAGFRSIIPLKILRVESYESSPGRTRSPEKRDASSPTAVSDSAT